MARSIADATASVVEDASTALPEVLRAEAAASRIADRQALALALASTSWLRAEIYLRTNRAALAEPVLTKALDSIAWIKQPLKVRGDLLMSQGNLWMLEDKAAAALGAFQEAYRTFGALQDRRSEALALQNLGALYSSANDDARAERYYKQAAEAFAGDPILSLTIHNRRGNVLLTLERYREAEAEYLAALKIARGINKPLTEARVLANLARNQVEARQFDAADRTIERGFALTRSNDAIGLRRSLLATAARLAADRGDEAGAARFIRECFAGLDLTTTSIEFRTAHLYAYQIFRKSGDIRLALRHLEALRRLNDEAVKVSTTASASLMSARFDFARQEAQIANLQRAEAIREVQFQRTLFLSIGGATLVIIALLSFGVVTLRRSRNQVRAANVVLHHTNIALEKALQAKTEFLATTSHEIRTPLNGILGMTQVMLADAGLAPQMRDRIGIVHDAGVTMRSLVDDILDVAKMETGNLVVDPAPMDLCAMLRDVTRLWEEQARAKGLTFDLQLSHAPHWIVSDAGRLRQIVFNLLSNAVKFTERGSVGLRAVQEGAGDALRLRLEVSDSGIGIPAAKFDEIFESFRQVDTSTTRRFGGTGLGLAICRNLARALGGDIAVESDEGQGSRFIVDLPLVLAAAPVADARDTGAAGGMLIVDRNPIARSMLRTLFEPRVAAVRFAGTVEEALAALAEGGMTHMLIDESTLKASGGDPMETLGKLVGAARAGDSIASAILWVRPDAETISQLMQSGVGQVIEKPVAGAALVEAMLAAAQENSNPGGSDPLVSRAA
ncbi:ATP-binding protein [Sphingomonas hengshuiensis]|uniref:ATP-binding protein n=1 Tax=Sphingomonas hengshuiensis TaxID=1609977 RepID=UPI0012B91530|nr:ATP-binding protein [Sphingomonas hengshuiensis]